MEVSLGHVELTVDVSGLDHRRAGDEVRVSGRDRHVMHFVYEGVPETPRVVEKNAFHVGESAPHYLITLRADGTVLEVEKRGERLQFSQGASPPMSTITFSTSSRGPCLSACGTSSSATVSDGMRPR